MNTFLASMKLLALMLISPNWAKPLTLIERSLLKDASPGEATLIRLTRPPGANTKPEGREPAAPMFTVPPTKEIVWPTGTCKILLYLVGWLAAAELNTPVRTSIGAGFEVRKPKAAGGAVLSRLLADDGTALKRAPSVRPM